MKNELIRYDAMCTAIDKAYAVDEVKDIRDKAVAFEAYSRQARNVSAERKACDIRIRAERKAGELLKKMEKAKGAQGTGSNQHRKVVRGHNGSAPDAPAGEEPVYTKRDSLTDEDVKFNVQRMRRVSDAVAKHADALELWHANRKLAAE